MKAMNTPTDNNWHLDKKVPIALLLALLAQFGVVMVFIGELKTQGQENTRRISVLEGQRISERLSSLEAQVADAKSLLVRIEGKLDGKIDRYGERR